MTPLIWVRVVVVTLTLALAAWGLGDAFLGVDRPLAVIRLRATAVIIGAVTVPIVFLVREYRDDE